MKLRLAFYLFGAALFFLLAWLPWKFFGQDEFWRYYLSWRIIFVPAYAVLSMIVMEHFYNFTSRFSISSFPRSSRFRGNDRESSGASSKAGVETSAPGFPPARE